MLKIRIFLQSPFLCILAKVQEISPPATAFAKAGSVNGLKNALFFSSLHFRSLKRGSILCRTGTIHFKPLLA